MLAFFSETFKMPPMKKIVTRSVGKKKQAKEEEEKKCKKE